MRKTKIIASLAAAAVVLSPGLALASNGKGGGKGGGKGAGNAGSAQHGKIKPPHGSTPTAESAAAGHDHGEHAGHAHGPDAAGKNKGKPANWREKRKGPLHANSHAIEHANEKSGLSAGSPVTLPSPKPD